MIIGVDNSHSMLLIVGIEHLQHVLADQLVVSIQVDYNRILAAVIPHSQVNVLQRCPALAIVEVDIFAGADVVEEEVVSDELVAAVVRGVVDDDCEVVRVIMGEDGVEVVL